MVAKTTAFLMAIIVVILTIMTIDRFGPRVAQAADNATPLTKGNSPPIIRRIVREEIKSHHDEVMGAIGTIKGRMDQLGNCLDKICAEKKTATRQTSVTARASAPMPKQDVEIAKDGSWLKIDASGEAANILARKLTKSDSCCDDKQAPPPPMFHPQEPRMPMPQQQRPTVREQVKRCYDRRGWLWHDKVEIPCDAPPSCNGCGRNR